MQASHVFAHWERVRAGLLDGLALVPSDRLDWSPGPGLWSIRETALHVADSERGWLGYPITRALDRWPEPTPPGSAPDVEAIARVLAEAHAPVVAFLDALDAADLDRPLELPWGRTATYRWAMWHLVEHEIHHRGEIFLALGLLGIEAPDV